MKALLWMVLCLTLSGVISAQEAPAGNGASPAATDRLFLPHDMFWGYGQFDVAPPHNEIDPNLCRADAGISGGVNDPCTAFARYMLSGYVEIRPFGRTQLRRFFLFGEPRFLFGKNLPQTLYTWSFDAIGVERSWGAGIYMGKGVEMRVTQHFLFSRFGARDRNLGPADLGPNGPWGRYNTIGVRKYFGHRRY
ncbi:MAG: hypothetical protein ACRD3H_16000 [Terriglobales bacterium]